MVEKIRKPCLWDIAKRMNHVLKIVLFDISVDLIKLILERGADDHKPRLSSRVFLHVGMKTLHAFYDPALMQRTNINDNKIATIENMFVFVVLRRAILLVPEVSAAQRQQLIATDANLLCSNICY